MQSAQYYRRQAAKAKCLRDGTFTQELIDTLDKVIRDYEDIAVDLEKGAIDVVHPELLPQKDHLE